MRQTLFHFPPEIGGFPVFGFGLALVAWCVLAGLMLWSSYRKHGSGGETLGLLPVLLLVAGAICFVLPRIEEHFANPGGGTTNLGLPIRGYGVMVFLGVVSGVALAVYRAGRMGIESEVIFGLAFAMFISGIVGARLFYIIQYWDSIKADTISSTLTNMVSIISGGLVVYGSLIGAMIGFSYFMWKNKLPALAIADLIAPSMALGLAFGRIGCLLNGCCYGGVCEKPWAITFPMDSPPYSHQKSLGLFHGVRLSDSTLGVIVAEIQTDDLAGREIAVGDVVRTIDDVPVANLQESQRILAFSGDEVTLGLDRGRRFVLGSNRALPTKSRPVHPTQIYSSLNALFICLLGLAFYPFRNRDGQVIGLVLSAYAVTRFMLEMIRNDESSFYSTGLTISQNVSIGMGVALVVLLAYVWSRPKGLALEA